MAQADIERFFPHLSADCYTVTSVEDESYNCFAWAAGHTDKWVSPTPLNGYYWPTQVSRDISLETFIKLYEYLCGYAPCESGDLEDGFEKIVI